MLTRSRLELDGTIAELRLPQLERRLTQAKLPVKLDPDRREALQDRRRGAAPATGRSQLTVFGGSVGTSPRTAATTRSRSKPSSARTTSTSMARFRCR